MEAAFDAVKRQLFDQLHDVVRQRIFYAVRHRCLHVAAPSDVPCHAAAAGDRQWQRRRRQQQQQQRRCQRCVGAGGGDTRAVIAASCCVYEPRSGLC